MRLLSRYANPFTDFSFKRLFGTWQSKQSLIDFLNALIGAGNPIININFLNTEKLGKPKHSRRSVFDIFCEDNLGNKFIIEIQRVPKPYFIDRAIYYSSFAIQEQSERGIWDFNIKKNYTVCLLDYCFDKQHPGQAIHTFKLVDIENNSALEQLVIYNIELPKFKKKENELKTRLDQWLYVLNNLTNFEEIPTFLKDDKIFKTFFMEAEITNFSKQQYWAYVASMKDIWENNRTKAAFKQYEEEIKRIAKEIKKEAKKAKQAKQAGIQLILEAVQMKKAGEPLEKIMQKTQLSAEIVEQL